jgi:multiple sugar transport system substrate-binding protein
MSPTYKALTWDHPRGFHALRDAAAEMAPAHGVSIHWATQPLEGFESHPIADLCARHDLVVLDHPHVGEAFEAGCLQPLEAVFGADEIAALGAASIGPSLTSYHYAGRHWALPLDAATQVMAYRPDLAEPAGTWREVAARASRGGVALSLAGPHVLMNFLSICVALGDPPAEADPSVLVGADAGEEAFGILAEIYAVAERSTLALNPIGLLGHMAQHDDVALCPLVYGYVNYARPQAGAKQVRFADAPAATAGGRPGSTLGGTGIGLSARCTVTPALLTHLRWLLGEAAQRSFMPAHDGQPSRRSAWHDESVNAAWGDFYRDTAKTLEAAYVRPRYAGYIAWQSAASAYLREALAQGTTAPAVVRHLNDTHRARIGGRER